MSKVEAFRIIPDDPANYQSGGNIHDSLTRLMRILRIFSSLYQIRAFDSNFRLLNLNGTPVPDANIGELLELTQSKQDRLTGLEEFIEQLIRANIDLNLIINNNIRERLRAGRERGTPPAGDQPFNPDGDDNDNDENNSPGGQTSYRPDDEDTHRPPFPDDDDDNGDDDSNSQTFNQDNSTNRPSNNTNINDDDDDDDTIIIDNESLTENRPESPALIPPPLPPPQDHRREENILYPNPNPADIPLPDDSDDSDEVPDVIDERLFNEDRRGIKRKLSTDSRGRKRRKSCDEWLHSNTSSSSSDENDTDVVPKRIKTKEIVKPTVTKSKILPKNKIIKSHIQNKKYDLRSRKDKFRGWHLI